MGNLILPLRARGTAMTAGSHLSVDDVAGLIDGTLLAPELARAERHLAECDECREEVAACTRVVASGTPSVPAPRPPWRLLLPLAAGIVAAVVIGTDRPGSDATSAERATLGSDARIAVVSPAASGSVVATSARFTWRPIDGSIGYRVVVKDAAGAPVWSGDSPDTTLTLPASVTLRAGAVYVWRVDGQRADGTTASSVETGFRVVR